MYQGTSLWLWAVQGFVWLCVAALALLAGAALVGLGYLAWRGWLALRDRRDPPERVERGPFDQRRTAD
jgi:threonine/homoserine/homoserine lactone efflux protein